MPTEVIKEIRPTGGGDYTTLDSWESSERKDLVAADEVAVAEVYGGGNAKTPTVRLNINSSTWVTDATRNIVIRAADGEEHAGVVDRSTKAYAEVTTGTQGVFLVGSTHYVAFEKMQILHENATTITPMLIFIFQSPEVNIDRCLLIGESTGTGDSLLEYRQTGSSHTISNSVLLYRDNSGTATTGGTLFVQGSPASTVDMNNCTAVLETNGASGFKANVFARDSNVINARNTYASTLAGSSYSAFETIQSAVINLTTCASSDTSGSAGLQNVPYSTATFVNVTAGSENLQIQPTSSLQDAGTDLTAQGITEDVIGVARPQFSAFDVGAFENEVPICWNYTAPYKGSTRLFKASGPGAFPRQLNVPSNVDTSQGKMIDDGQLIDPDEYDVS